ncbi:MAG: hypothetical protein QG635_881 [Bacteroidota bacterium]|nr:hypothetical protein [Bacteroidota bacterium]
MEEDFELISKKTVTYDEKIKFFGDKLLCPSCDFYFGIVEDYIGVITCPYCGEYVEGM